MERIRQQLARIQQQFAALSASQRMLASALVAIMVMTLLWWAKYAGTAEMEPVTSAASSPEEMLAIQAKLTAENIPNVVVGAAVMVPAERKLQAIALLASERMLPHDGGGGFEETIKNISSFESQTTKDRMWNVALQYSLSQIICAMPGVSNCTVIIDPTVRERVEGSVQPTAAVHVHMKAGRAGDRKLADSIGYLVSGSNASLSKSRVNVVIDGKSFQLTDRSGDSIGSATDMVEQQAAEERRNEQKIMQALRSYGEVIATVTVKLDVISAHTTEKTVTAVKSVESKNETNSTETSAPAANGGDVGAGANTGASIAQAPIASDKQTSTEEHSKTEMQNYPSMKEESTNKPSGQPTVVSAAVHIPRAYFIDLIKRQSGAQKEPDDKSVDAAFDSQRPRIAQAVMRAVGLNDESVISIDASPDAPPMLAAIASAGAGEPSASTSAIAASLTSHAKEIGLGALALISLFMVSSMVKKGAPAPAIAMPIEEPEPVRLATGEMIAGEVGEGNPMLDGMELDEDSIKAQQMVEQVSTLVKENPDAAANLVKRWLNRS